MIDGTGPVAAVFVRAMSGAQLSNVTVACRSLGAVDATYRQSSREDGFIVSVNGLSSSLHDILANDPAVGAINFTAWLGISNGEPVVRDMGTVIASSDESTANIAARVARAFGLWTRSMETALHVQILKLAVNLPGVVCALCADHLGRESALRLEAGVLSTLAEFMAAHDIRAEDLDDFPVRRLLSLAPRANGESALAELESLVRAWRGWRKPEAVRRIVRGDTQTSIDMRSTLLHIGVTCETVQQILDRSAGGPCRS